MRRYIENILKLGACLFLAHYAEAFVPNSLTGILKTSGPLSSRDTSCETPASDSSALHSAASSSSQDSTSSSSSAAAHHTLVLLRHGESQWNQENRFTGWADVPLSSNGVTEARAAGKLLKDNGYHFDYAFTSTLKRAVKTLWLTLEEMDLMYVPVTTAWRLNERHYGGLQGMNKQETVALHGKEKVMEWRRSYDIPPPPLPEQSDLARYRVSGGFDRPEDLPLTESLKDTEKRVVHEWTTRIAPLIRQKNRVLIAAHGNTLRALVKYLDGISEADITELNIPTAAPLVYHLDSDLKPVRKAHPFAMKPLSGFYLGDQEQIKARIGGVAAQTK